MLSPRTFAALGLVLAMGAPAAAQDDVDGMQRPERLTIGTADQFLGSLSPDEKTLYFASNRNTITEIYSQNLATGAPKILFDESADVTWPRISPDGKQLLYISFRQNALGQLCVRSLPDGGARCLGDIPGAVQAQWSGPSRIVLLSRPTAQGDMRISLVDASGKLSAKTLFDRNLTSLATSPDGKWLVYTPIERYVQRIGPGFAARAGRNLVAQRIDRPDEAPVIIELDAPGLTGQAAFSMDGKVLFFIQFISDSNHDGIIDGNDHGLLFRVPFEPDHDDAAKRLAGAMPEQLTDASWNCQYPAPSTHKVVITCERGDHLDAYSLPLTGMVPDDWDAARIRTEASVTTSDYELMLLHTQLLGVEKDLAKRRSEMVSLLRLHLRLEEFEAADFYSSHISAQRDTTTAGVGSALRILCEHRRALRARERGRLSLDFIPESEKRMATLAEAKVRSPAGDTARHVVRSEIADVLGDKTLARSELEAVNLDGVDSPGVLQLFADRADALYREVDDAEYLTGAYKALALLPQLPATDRITYARAAMRSLVRGRPGAEARATLTALKLDEGSDLDFARGLALVMLDIVDANPSKDAQAQIIALYKAQKTPERRRAVIVDLMERAWERGAQGLMETLVELYVKDVPKGTAERRRAARMYRRMIEDRAYDELGHGNREAARDDFHAVALATGSLESWTGYIDRRIQEGSTVEMLEVELFADGKLDKDGSVGRYVQAYLLCRKLPKLERDEAVRVSNQAVTIIRGAWTQLKEQPEALTVMGAILHEQFLHSGDHAAAQRATAVYLVALDLGKRNVRYKAMLLSELAILQAQVGNWRIAIDYFEQREKLPFVDNVNGLTHRLEKARTLLHLDREAEGAKVMDEALALVDKTPRMAPYRALVLDRDALYHLAAGEFDRSLALYDLLLPLLADLKGPSGARNRLVVRLAQSSAALGAGKPQIALDQIEGVEKLLEVKDIGETLRWKHATEEQTMWTYRVIAAGLRAKAFTALHRFDEARTALEARSTLYKQELKRAPVDALVRDLALVDTQLADLALQQNDGAGALAHAKAAVERLDPVVKKSDKPFDDDQLVALWMAAEARMSTDAKLPLKLRQRLATAIDALGAHTSPKTVSVTRSLEIELGLLGPSPVRPPALTKKPTKDHGKDAKK